MEDAINWLLHPAHSLFEITENTVRIMLFAVFVWMWVDGVLGRDQ